MQLPADVLQCMDTLERAGFAAYAVGGCVRDLILGLQPQDYDLCTNALPKEIQAVFSGHTLVLAGVKHGTVGVVCHGEVIEITTYRTEGGYSDNRHPDWVRFVPDIREDLARRDFTVNAMAWSPKRGFADPFGGQQDLKSRILRAVGNPTQRFQEDALRILRGARFAAKYRLNIQEETLNAMFAQRQLMDGLARERIFSELCKLITAATREDLLLYAPILTQVIPELAPMEGFDQRNPYHTYDLYTHTAAVTAGVPGELSLRLAALLHDVGKVDTFTVDADGWGHFYGHEATSAELAKDILHRLKAPTALTEQVVTLVGLHMHWLVPERKPLRRWLSRLGESTLRQLIALQHADLHGKGNPPETDHTPELYDLLDTLLQEDLCLSLKDLAVDGHDLIAIGFPPGKALGVCLQSLHSRVLDEQLPNEKNALLRAAAELLPPEFI